MVCAENHKRFVYPNLAMRLMDHIANPEVSGLNAASKRGLFKKRSYCAKCSAELSPAKADSKDYRFSVPLPDIQSVTVSLKALVVTCAQCGAVQLPDEADLMKYIFKAMTRAFRSAEIHAE